MLLSWGTRVIIHQIQHTSFSIEVELESPDFREGGILMIVGIQMINKGVK